MFMARRNVAGTGLHLLDMGGKASSWVPVLLVQRIGD